LREKLLRRGFAESVVTEVLERFVAVGLVDDAEYAACLVRARFNERGLARRGIAAELQRKGVSSEVASRALQQIDDDSQFSAAVTVAHKSLAHTEKQETSVRTRRAVAKLARLGYPSETAFSAVRQALAEMS
jgi:regulatory protein